MLKICKRKLGLGVVVGSRQSRGSQGIKSMEHFNISLFFSKSFKYYRKNNFLSICWKDWVSISYHLLLIARCTKISLSSRPWLFFVVVVKTLFMLYVTFHSHSTHSACKLIFPLADITYTKIYCSIYFQ